MTVINSKAHLSFWKEVNLERLHLIFQERRLSVKFKADVQGNSSYVTVSGHKGIPVRKKYYVNINILRLTSKSFNHQVTKKYLIKTHYNKQK